MVDPTDKQIGLKEGTLPIMDLETDIFFEFSRYTQNSNKGWFHHIDEGAQG